MSSGLSAEQGGLSSGEAVLDILSQEIVKYYASEFVSDAQVRIEQLGSKIGFALAERFSRLLQQSLWLLIATRLTMDRGIFTDHVDILKFICKDLWLAIYRKQVDNLKTNHRVSYITECPMGLHR